MFVLSPPFNQSRAVILCFRQHIIMRAIGSTKSMKEEITLVRMRFNKSLEPIKVMLVNRRQTLSSPEWLRFVEHTKTSIIHNPDQYLGSEIPPQEMLVEIIERIFSDFLHDLSLRRN